MAGEAQSGKPLDCLDIVNANQSGETFCDSRCCEAGKLRRADYAVTTNRLGHGKYGRAAGWRYCNVTRMFVECTSGPVCALSWSKVEPVTAWGTPGALEAR